MSASPFELRVIHPTYEQAGRLREGEYGVALYQHPPRLPAGRHGAKARTAQPDEPRLVARIWGTPFRCTVDRLIASLKANGYRASDLNKSRNAPFALDEETGVRLGLLLLGAKPLRKPTRIEAISGAIWAMGAEEAYYWFSKCADNGTGRRARRALRTLLAES